MTTRIPLMAGNWKMNLDHLQATHLVQKLDWTLKDGKHDYGSVEVVVLPPFTDLRTVQTLVQGDNMRLEYGAQDVSRHEEGAYTGEIPAAFLAKLGCTYVLVGHSERRQYHQETDELVAAKLLISLRHGLSPILCVGEPLEVRQRGEQVPHVVAQLKAALQDLEAEQMVKVAVAYEPIWAIGTGEVATPPDAQEVCAAIRSAIAETYAADVAAAVRVLYGGSVKPSNVAQIMAQEDVDGALVGGASLSAEDFASICRYQHHHGGQS